MIPEQMTSTMNVYNTISSRIDPIKNQTIEGRTSYLDAIKEESEARRTRFYKSNLAMIYAQSGTGIGSLQNSTILEPMGMDDRGSVKSD